MERWLDNDRTTAPAETCVDYVPWQMEKIVQDLAACDHLLAQYESFLLPQQEALLLHTPWPGQLHPGKCE